MENMDKYLDKLIELLVVWGPKLIGAIVVLIIGLWVVKMITKGFGKMLEKKNVDPSLVPFLKSLTSTLLKALVLISVMGMVGIQMTSFIAIIGAAGLAVGMALSGTLQNFAGGVVILIFRPFNVGDFIEAQGYMGTVKAITIFTTKLNTVDNKVIIIPNGPLSTGSLTNFSKEPQRRVDWKFGIAYGDDMENFKKAINEFIAEDERILKDPEHFIGLVELGDSSVNFAVRAWVNAADYWGVFFDMNEKVYKRFKDYDLNIPFPQMDVHLDK
ncbi:MAG: mechanosensitive ion channel [Candidatus Delongbacteria bacterium]|nr:mechanosensitive ion channel [Candidatus Delongbacteria bacterium]